jgi:hypothetical protein
VRILLRLFTLASEIARRTDSSSRKLSAIGKFRRLLANAHATYSVGMTRRLYNWTYRDVTEFLKEDGFSFFKELEGSHEAWIKLGEDNAPDWIVEVNFTHGSYPPRTLKTMILKSGIAQNEWIKWAAS